MLLTTLEYHVFVTLPLWVLSVAFHPLLPVAIASLLVSVGVCVVAGAQAWLPKDKRRWWSRPLVALLFFLQPIVRGWARYSGRLRLRPGDAPSRETLDSVTLRDSGESLGEVQYWAARRVDRVEFVSSLLEELERRRWPHRSDIGWSEFDVEIHGNRWSQVQLSTVAEEHPRGRQLIRCRLRAGWSLQATVAFWSLLGLELLTLEFFFDRLNWLGLLLLTLPLFAWFLARQKRDLQSVVVVFLDELAQQWKLTKIPSAVVETRVRKPAPMRIHLAPAAERPAKPSEPAGKEGGAA
jgi:hypothetical protein